VDTDLPSPRDFSESGLPLQQLAYQLAPRSLVMLLRSKSVALRVQITDTRS
jgi:hypothetical protein